MGKVLCYSVKIKRIEKITHKSYKIFSFNGMVDILPASQIYGIDTETKVIESTPKTIESRRDIPISRDLLGILKKFKACYNDNFYVITSDEMFCEPRTYRNYYKHLILDEVGLDRCIKFHGLRHSFATRMIASKADMKTTSRILGHSDVSTTMNLYVHPSMSDKLEAVNKSMKNLFKK